MRKTKKFLNEHNRQFTPLTKYAKNFSKDNEIDRKKTKKISP